MSEDLIKRSDVIEVLESEDCFGYIECKTKALVKDINAIPSADRPQGHWTKTDVATYRCSECGKKQIADDINELNFCCCCGSRNKVWREKGQTMSDPIERADAIKAINCWCECNSLPQVGAGILHGIPSADRPQGKWRAKSFHEYFCNKCGFSFDMMKCEFLENMKFCPNCGVRKGADDE